MTTPQFPLPVPTQSLEYPDVHNGLSVDANCWEKERKYNQQRQNLHYRSLNQPGIVCGLGVRLMTQEEQNKELSPDDKEKGRWIKIQPGIAIDLDGNPIIVNKEVVYKIKNQTDEDVVTVYLSVSLSDAKSSKNEASPQASSSREYENNNKLKLVSDGLPHFHQSIEATNGEKIELCRILLNPKNKILTEPKDIGVPKENELDFRYRIPATWRSPQTVKVGLLVAPRTESNLGLSESEQKVRDNLSELMRSVEVLYPKMQGQEVDVFSLKDFYFSRYPDRFEFDKLTENSQSQEIEFKVTELRDRYTCLYLDASQENRQLNKNEKKLLQEYLEFGGLLVVETKDENPIDLIQDLQDLQWNIDNLSWDTDREESLNNFLLKEPFLFNKLPKLSPSSSAIEFQKMVNQERGTIIFIKSFVTCSLVSAWGGEPNLSRSEIRTAHELGINLLYFIWNHWRQIQCFS